MTVKLPESEAEGETVNKTLEEPADAVDARVSLLLLQVSMKLVQFGHQDLTNTVVSAKLGWGWARLLFQEEFERFPALERREDRKLSYLSSSWRIVG